MCKGKAKIWCRASQPAKFKTHKRRGQAEITRAEHKQYSCNSDIIGTSLTHTHQKNNNAIRESETQNDAK